MGLRVGLLGVGAFETRDHTEWSIRYAPGCCELGRKIQAQNLKGPSMVIGDAQEGALLKAPPASIKATEGMLLLGRSDVSFAGPRGGTAVFHVFL